MEIKDFVKNPEYTAILPDIRKFKKNGYSKEFTKGIYKGFEITFQSGGYKFSIDLVFRLIDEVYEEKNEGGNHERL